MTELEEAVKAETEQTTAAEQPSAAEEAPEAVGIPEEIEITETDEREEAPAEDETEEAEEVTETVELPEADVPPESSEGPETEASPESGEAPEAEAADIEAHENTEEAEPENIEVVWRLTDEVRQDLEEVEAKAETSKAIEEKRERRKRSSHRYTYVGTFSAALSLIVMGVSMTMSLSSPAGINGAFKAAPLMLVFLGIEILAAILINRSVRLKFSIKSLVITVLLIGISFALSLISATWTVTGGERVYAKERLHNILSKEISRELSDENISNVDIDMLLYGEEPGDYKSLSDLKEGDVVNISFIFSKTQESVYEFAKECRRIMDTLEEMPYSFDEVKFSVDEGGSRYSLRISWLYQSEMSARDLIPLVGYYGEDVVLDIPDIEDEK